MIFVPDLRMRRLAFFMSSVACSTLLSACGLSIPTGTSCGTFRLSISEPLCEFGDDEDEAPEAAQIGATVAEQGKKISAPAGKGPTAASTPPEEYNKDDDDVSPALVRKLEAKEVTAIPRTAASGTLSLSDVVRRAQTNSPQIGIAVAGRIESDAGVRAASSAFMPTFDIGTASGHDTYGTFKSADPLDYFARSNSTGAWRNDARLSASMMIYDFGAADSDVLRATRTRDASALREAATAEDVAYAAAQYYVKLQQSRELLALAEDNLTALRAIAELISTNAQDGNATKADIKRVEARVLDAESARADQDYDLRFSTEKFIRLVNLTPGKLSPAPLLDSALPPNATQALAEAFKKNPVIIANAAVVEAARAEAETLKSAQKPRVTLETGASSKSYRGQNNKTEVDVSGMLSLSYKLGDGGLSTAKHEQASARLTQAQMRDIDGREALEQDIRQQYLLHSSSRAKRDGLMAGLKSSEVARVLYQEQFRGGKRTLLELLEVQNAYYTARYNSIVNASDLRLSSYAILKSLGRLAPTLLAEK